MNKCGFKFSLAFSQVMLVLMLMPVSVVQAGVTAEQVLGEYWKDPLFGQAAADYTVNLEVLYKRIWPMEVTVPAGKNIRFLVDNKSKKAHLIAFSKDPAGLTSDQEFQAFIKDELYHAEQKKAASAGGHHHNHGGGESVEETQDIVKTLAQRPTVFVLGYEQKEILINFSDADTLTIFCAMDGHEQEGYVSVLKVENSTD